MFKSKITPLSILFGALAGVGLYQLTRTQPLRTPPVAQPAKSYTEALAMIAQIDKGEAALNPRCAPQLLTHGHKTQKAIALIHGYTNCPLQFNQVAPLFFALGYNVFVPRLPKHGLADRLSPLQGTITAHELVANTAQTIAILGGLGEEITVLGFSLGGVLATWATYQGNTQLGNTIDQLVLIAPAFAVQGMPVKRRQLLANLFALLPNFFQWWDPEKKSGREGPQHAYPRWSTHGVAAMIRLGGLVEQAARQAKPAAKRITIITNPCDTTVDNQQIATIAALWQQQGAAVQTHCFNKEWNLIHDLIDPDQPAQQVDRVYPQIMEWVGE